MGFIPSEARWYLAEVVLEHRIAGDARNVVHVNIHLIEAGSPENAYEKAMVLGRSGEMTYENTEGRSVQVVFRGLRDLNVIHDPLEDGAELTYEEEIGVSEDRLCAWITSKPDLTVFAPIAPVRDTPNYLPIEFEWLVREVLPTSDDEGDAATDDASTPPCPGAGRPLL